MYVSADEAVGEVLHGVHQKVPAYGLDDVLYKLRTVALKTLPLFRGSNAFISDGFTAELILSYAGFHIAEPSL